MDEQQIWTIGHWTCPESTFIHRLVEQDIDILVDVRAHPGSRASPQFGQDVMPVWLGRAAIDYVHFTDLGGRRRKQDVDQELNAGWNNASFKNYADYTLSDDYRAAIARLIDVANTQHVVFMCAEPMPWRCHRLLISNTLTAQGWTVRHIMGNGAPRTHTLGQWGATPTISDSGQVTYPPTSLDSSSEDSAVT